jgi:hypothetical protein
MSGTRLAQADKADPDPEPAPRPLGHLFEVIRVFRQELGYDPRH